MHLWEAKEDSNSENGLGEASESAPHPTSYADDIS